jgi:mutator protein MutT
MNVPATRIGIAVVEHAGCYLIGTRGPDGPLPGYAEFPGGKCLPDESPEACTVRECREETHLAVTVDRLLLRQEHTYPHGTVDLHFFLCHPVEASLIRDEHHGFVWIPAGELPRLRLPDANAAVVRMLEVESQRT